ncbi:polar amino acid transport system permease protein [Marinitoga hydrogenitolerans DSM 16785]|uniref:Polar amino acid transport system permease protein n=1 Tax=Marinitoga hydrogenitolerans (strain DSM 16785 / JCM 12826 / AT1271) TaxID=1122195 RepID=A0A1M4X8U4_MARH1|nr:polar amino acid transport system permease protein [Marinitoga hydrogenitolerans DSM 16785]
MNKLNKNYLQKFIAYAVLIFILTVFYMEMSKTYPFNWQRVPFKYMNLYLQGFYMTLKISVFSVLFALIIGIIFGVMKTSKYQILKEFANTYTTIFRNIPLLVIILIVYYGIGSMIEISATIGAIVSLSLFEGAYISEIIRGGIEAVSKGQVEAAKTIGLNTFYLYIDILLPQAFRTTLPALTGQFISLVKDSSLASVIALQELTMVGRQIATSSFASFESYITVAIFYFTITALLQLLGKYFERRFAII